MLVLTVLALAVIAEGYRLESQSTSPRSLADMFLGMCIKNGASYTAVEVAAQQFITCMEDDFEIKIFENELKQALKNNTESEFNRVFGRYCDKTPAMKACYQKLVNVVAPCFGNEKEDLVKVSTNVNGQILNYLCENDGSVMTRFIMEGGPQCFQEKTYDIMMCSEMAKSSVLQMVQNSSLSATASYRVYNDLLQCILRSVETCHNPISLTIVKKVGEIVKQSISEEDTKNITCGSQKKLFKLSGTVNVAFNANLNI